MENCAALRIVRGGRGGELCSLEDCKGGRE